jgi:protein involved in plasmid replication-relaxation
MTIRKDEILNYLYTFRFLTRNQIQALLNHKHFNRVIIWLNQLSKQGHLFRYYDPKAVTVPAIYSLGLKARAYLKQTKSKEINQHLLDRVWRERSLSIQFRQHCIFIADCYLSLLKQCKQNNSKLHFYTKTQLYGMRYLVLPHPDAYIAIEEPDGQIHRYFLDVFNDTPPRMILRKRVKQYLEYFEEEIWQDKTGHPFPKIILITPDARSKNYLERIIKATLEDEPELEIYLGSREMVREKGLDKEALRKIENLNY